MLQHLKYRGARRRERARNWKLIWTNNEGNFPNLAKERDFQEVQEAQRVPKKLDTRKHTPRHIIITLPKMKDKQRILKAAREEETVTCKGVPIRLSADFLKETLQARRGWKELFKVALIIQNVKRTYLRKRRWSKIWTVKWQQIHNYQ